MMRAQPRNRTAILALESGKTDGVKILPPAKHVIGETHDLSKFADAVQDWGWGADKMVEAMSSHPRVRQPKKQTKAVKNKKDPTNYQAKELENTVAKQLTWPKTSPAISACPGW
jgi:hypothetical protein